MSRKQLPTKFLSKREPPTVECDFCGCRIHETAKICFNCKQKNQEYRVKRNGYRIL